MANLLERLKRLMPITASQNELHESDEKAVKHEVVQRNVVTKERSTILEPARANRSFVDAQDTPSLSDTVLSSLSCNSLQNTATLEPLPLELRALVRAASSGVLPKGAVILETGITFDLERYVLGFAAQYVTGDQAHAILELRACLRAWQTMTRKAISA